MWFWAVALAATPIPQLVASLQKVNEGLAKIPHAPEGIGKLRKDIAAAVTKLQSDKPEAEKRRAADAVKVEIDEFKATLSKRQEKLKKELTIPVPKLIASLESVQKGLKSLPSMPAGMPALEVDIASALKELRSDAPDADKQRTAMRVEKEIEDFKASLTRRQEQLEAASRATAVEDREQELFKRLMDVQDDPMESQLAIVRSERYNATAAAQAVLSAKLSEEPLAIVVGKFLDREKAVPGVAQKPQQLAAIANSLSARAANLKVELASMDAKEASRERQASSAPAAQSAAIAEAGKALKFFDRAAHREFLKRRVVVANEEKTLESAVDAIKKGDGKKVQAALDSLKKLNPHPLV